VKRGIHGFPSPSFAPEYGEKRGAAPYILRSAVVVSVAKPVGRFREVAQEHHLAGAPAATASHLVRASAACARQGPLLTGKSPAPTDEWVA
jgi:hypothetical protein